LKLVNRARAGNRAGLFVDARLGGRGKNRGLSRLESCLFVVINKLARLRGGSDTEAVASPPTTVLPVSGLYLQERV
jgi:hypothetical protein